jgi:hypothetical protein
VHIECKCRREEWPDERVRTDDAGGVGKGPALEGVLVGSRKSAITVFGYSGKEEVGGVLPELGREALERGGHESIVIAEHEHQRALCVRPSELPIVRDDHMPRCSHILHARVRELPDCYRSVVSRGVVAKHYLEIRERLPEHGLNGERNNIGAIERGDDDTEQGMLSCQHGTNTTKKLARIATFRSSFPGKDES